MNHHLLSILHSQTQRIAYQIIPNMLVLSSFTLSITPLRALLGSSDASGHIWFTDAPSELKHTQMLTDTEQSTGGLMLGCRVVPRQEPGAVTPTLGAASLTAIFWLCTFFFITVKILFRFLLIGKNRSFFFFF